MQIYIGILNIVFLMVFNPIRYCGITVLLVMLATVVLCVLTGFISRSMNPVHLVPSGTLTSLEVPD